MREEEGNLGKFVGEGRNFVLKIEKGNSDKFFYNYLTSHDSLKNDFVFHFFRVLCCLVLVSCLTHLQQILP